MPFSLGAFVGTGVSVPLGVKLGKIVMFAGAALQAAAVAWAIQVVQHDGPDLRSWHLAPPSLLGGIGLGLFVVPLVVVPLVDVALATVAPSDAGAASGAYGTFQQVGSAIGVGVVFFGVVGTEYTPAGLEHGLTAPAWISVAGYLLCALATVFLPSRQAVRPRAQVSENSRTPDRTSANRTHHDAGS